MGQKNRPRVPISRYFRRSLIGSLYDRIDCPLQLIQKMSRMRTIHLSVVKLEGERERRS